MKKEKFWKLFSNNDDIKINNTLHIISIMDKYPLIALPRFYSNSNKVKDWVSNIYGEPVYIIPEVVTRYKEVPVKTDLSFWTDFNLFDNEYFNKLENGKLTTFKPFLVLYQKSEKIFISYPFYSDNDPETFYFWAPEYDGVYLEGFDYVAPLKNFNK